MSPYELSRTLTSVLVMGGLVFALQGCDKINQLTEYFSPSKEPSQAALARPSAPAASAVAPTAPTAPVPGTVLARVGNWTLTKAEFKEKLEALKEVVPDYDINDRESNKLVLEELVRQELLVQEAERQGVSQNKDIVQAVTEFRRTLLVRQMVANLTEKIVVTDEEAKEYYDQNTADFAEPADWHLAEIVVDSEDKAKGLLAQIYKGEGPSFEDLARENSISETAASGGDLGYISVFPFPKMESAVAALEPGNVSSVFKGPAGFYIVKLIDKKGGEIQAFDGIKEDIKTGLTYLKQQQAVANYLDDLRRKAQVEVNEKLLEE